MKKAGIISGSTCLALFLSVSGPALGQGLGEYDPVAPPVEGVEETVEVGNFEIHTSMQSNPLAYANGFYLAYIKGPNDDYNQLSQNGLISLATQLYIRTGIEPEGIVALDPEVDDISLFPFIYYPVYDQTPRLSDVARQRMQDHKARPGTTIFANLVSPGSIVSSEIFRGILNDIGSGQFEDIEDRDLWTQSFYIIDAPTDIFSETLPEERQSVDAPSVLISDTNLAIAWIGNAVGPDVHENAIRFSINAIMATFMGTNKLDADHQETLDYKWELREENANRPPDDDLPTLPRPIQPNEEISGP